MTWIEHLGNAVLLLCVEAKLVCSTFDFGLCVLLWWLAGYDWVSWLVGDAA